VVIFLPLLFTTSVEFWESPQVLSTTWSPQVLSTTVVFYHMVSTGPVLSTTVVFYHMVSTGFIYCLEPGGLAEGHTDKCKCTCQNGYSGDGKGN
jgi:hypothetical protein